MTFQQLMYVVEISKCGSINKAANKLFLSQSAISTAVHELENELNISLFNRTNKGVELTADGREFLSFAVSLLEQKRLLESLYRENNNLTVTTRLSVSTQRYPFTETAFLRVLQGTKDNRYRYAIRPQRYKRGHRLPSFGKPRSGFPRTGHGAAVCLCAGGTPPGLPAPGERSQHPGLSLSLL